MIAFPGRLTEHVCTCLRAMHHSMLRRSKTVKLERGQAWVYIEQNYKCNTFVFAPIFHELNYPRSPTLESSGLGAEEVR